MSDCKVFGTEIDGAADGGVLGPRAAAHAASCAACGGKLRVRGLVRGLGRVEAPADFEYRLRARMAGSKPGGGHGVFAGLFPVRGLAWAALAVCVLSVTAAVYYRQAQQNAPGVAESAQAVQVPAGSTAGESNNANQKPTQPPEQTGGSQTVAVVPAPVLAQRASGVKRVVTQPRERELSTREPRVEPMGGGSLELGLRPAPVQLPNLTSANNGAALVQAQGIQLGTTAGTLRVVLRDERGTPVTMRSVSFGSQELLSRETATRRPNSKDEEGVW